MTSSVPDSHKGRFLEHGLTLLKISSPTKLEGKAVMIGRADQAWEMRDPANLKMQGPAVLERNGRVFIAYSSNATDARYAVGLMEASATADLLDPISWRKLPGPALESSSAAGLYGPGHNSFTTSPDGKVDYIVFHARDYEKVEGDGHTRSQPRDLRASLLLGC